MQCQTFLPAPGGDRILIRRAVAGDRDAFAELCDRSVPEVYRYLYYKVDLRADAEDLTALVFWKAWKGIHHFEWRERSFDTWLLRIAHGAVGEYSRTDGTMAMVDRIADQTLSRTKLGEAIQHEWTVETLRKALAELADDQQDVIILRFLDGFDTVETAQILDRAPEAIRVLERQALIRLSSLDGTSKPLNAGGNR